MQPTVLEASDGHMVQCYEWCVDTPRAAIHLAHGMGEHARRYDATAQALNASGFSVWANDHRGHGETANGDYGNMGVDGWNRVLADAYEINQMIRARAPDVPLILVGHSMGSMMSQQYITRYGASIDALALSGSPGFKDPKSAWIPRVLAAFESWRLGADQHSELLQNMLFGGANKPFDSDEATGFEWLSRDPEQVQRYVDDEACGFVLTAGSLRCLFAGTAITQREESLARIPKALPIYAFSGADDPVHGEQKDFNRMVQGFRSAGVSNLTYKLYPGGRHELFNETNADEVLADLIAWIEGVLASV